MASGLHFVVLLFLACQLGTVQMRSCSVRHCPSGWTRFGHRCVQFHFARKNWIDAERSCVALGGNLVSIHNPYQQHFISGMIHRLTGTNYDTWIGGSDGIKEGVWLWSDATRFNYRHFDRNQPDNFWGHENCLQNNFHGRTRWNDLDCKVALPYICARRL